LGLNERQVQIVRLIEAVRRVDVSDLTARFATSSVTIRKDLDVLQDRGILQRTHGGAILAENVEKTVPVEQKLGQMLEAKQAIGRKALELVFDCETVALDAGSTTLALARLLRDSPVTVVTNSLLIADELCGRESGSVVLVGGVWRRESSCYIGPAALGMLDGVNIDLAFLGVSGFTVRTGFTCQNSMEAQVKERILSRAERTFILGDSSKWGQRAFSTFAAIDGVSGLVTDEGLTADARRELEGEGLTIVTAPARAS